MKENVNTVGRYAQKHQHIRRKSFLFYGILLVLTRKYKYDIVTPVYINTTVHDNQLCQLINQKQIMICRLSLFNLVQYQYATVGSSARQACRTHTK